jgi:hypothetical protein
MTMPVGLFCLCARPGRVEPLDVDGRPRAQELHLAFGHRDTRSPLDRRCGLVEGTSGRLHRGQTAKSVGVQLVGEVQRSVGGVEVLAAQVAVGEPFDLHGAHHRRQLAGVASLHGRMGDAVSVDDVNALLTKRPQVEVVLERQALHLTATGQQLLFEIGMRHQCRLGSFQPAQHLLEAAACRGENVNLGHGSVHRSSPPTRPRPGRSVVPTAFTL